MEAGDHDRPASTEYAEPRSAQYIAAAYDFSPDAHRCVAIDQSPNNEAGLRTNDRMASRDKLLVRASNANKNGHTHVEDEDHAIPSPIAQNNNNTNNNTQPTTPISTSAKRKSAEEPYEVTPVLSDSKRKRSKVSRACDQCRRKKIRCDADVEGAGQLQTCSSCQKGGQTCEYSRIPQKRGPSKGYIKELSERVQQVEGQLALHTTVSYRASIDSQYGGLNESPFSPNEDPALRQRSLSSQNRNPFAGFARERFPSAGGWNNSAITSNPRHSSIAIPPDQIGSPQDKPPSVNTVKPFWTDWIVSPTKMCKDPLQTAELTPEDKTAFQYYYDTIHPLCPVLPDSQSTQLPEIFYAADKDFQEALILAVTLLSQPQNTSTSNADQLKLGNGRARLETFVNERARQDFVKRGQYHNSLVLLWAQLILLVVVQHDISSWNTSSLLQCDLIEMSFTNCDEFFRIKRFTSDDMHDMEFICAAQITVMIARLYAISQGEAHDPVPSSFVQHLGFNGAMPPRLSFLITMTDSLQASLSLLPQGGVPMCRGTSYEISRLQSANIRAWLTATGLARDDPLVAEVKAFAELLSLRCSGSRLHMPAVTGPAANLAEAIRRSSVVEKETNGGKYLYNPLSLHTFTLATITLLELLQCEPDDHVSESLVEDGIQEMRKSLMDLVDRRNANGGSADGRFWANVLLDMIERETKSRPALEGVSEDVNKKKEEDITVDLTRLLQRGYANILMDFVTKDGR